MSDFFSGFLIFLLLLGVLLSLQILGNLRFFKRRFDELQTFAYPAPVARRFQQEHPHLSPSQVRQVFLALTQFFSACFVYRFGWLNGQPKGQPRNRHGIGMPSKLADEAWHVYLLHTKEYQAFAKRFFKGRLDHTPDTPGVFPGEASERRYKPDVLNTWRTFKAMREKRLITFTGLPLLFTLDAQYQIEGGFIYTRADIPFLDAQALAIPPGAGDSSPSGSGCSSCSSSSSCVGDQGSGGDGDGGGDGGGGCGGD